MYLKMIIQLAWKNIWRNTIRSAVVLAAIAIGIWALMFILSFSSGMIAGYISSAIESRTSHLQIHKAEFIDDPEIRFFLDRRSEYANTLQSIPEIDRYTFRIITSGLVSSAAGNRGAQIKGIYPEEEAMLTRLKERVIEGSYLNPDFINPILISRGLARNLGVEIDQHVVLSFQGLQEDFVSGRFRISGYFDTGNTRADDLQVFVRYKDMLQISGLNSDHFHELAITLHNLEQADSVRTKLEMLFPQALVRTYKEISPDLAIYNEQIRAMLAIVIVVIMIALLFGIINTMLMAVLERQRELGMLMAIGMNRIRIFALIMIEAFILCIIAAPIGVLLGHTTILFLKEKGLDLSNWASGFEEFGLQPIIRPVLGLEIYFDIVLALVITAIIAGIYPALKAIRTKPVEALRKI